MTFSIFRNIFLRKYSNFQRGINVLRDPEINKGMGFSWRERHLLGIHGLLPPAIMTQEEQMSRVMNNLRNLDSDLSRYTFLMSLLDKNEKLFFSVVMQNVEYCMPLIYTPTVGLACQRYGVIFRKPRGLFMTIHDKNHIDRIFSHWPEESVRAVVVTDGERILGLGDLGAYGIGIPIGKLNLYTALASFRPKECLPVLLDVGTDNETLLQDPLYVGMRHKRIRGRQYDEFLDTFMAAVAYRYGRKTLIQFEDFGYSNATRLLKKYRNDYCTFNDDIQGTAAVVVSGLLSASRITQRPITNCNYLFFGAGGAAIGIATLLADAMVDAGITHSEACNRIFLTDKFGLLTKTHPDGQIGAEKQPFVKDLAPITDLESIMDLVKPNVIIGVTGAGRIFTPSILQKMNKFSERPVIFALSNPTSQAECTAQEAYSATEGRCVFASGSPFEPVSINGHTFQPGQGNNAYIFPGISLAVVRAGIWPITQDIFLVAAKSLANQVSAEADLSVGRVYPRLSQLLHISNLIAVDVMQYAYDKGLATELPEPRDKLGYLRRRAYDPEYENLVPEPYQPPRLV